jgi:hypothetical protein
MLQAEGHNPPATQPAFATLPPPYLTLSLSFTLTLTPTLTLTLTPTLTLPLTLTPNPQSSHTPSLVLSLGLVLPSLYIFPLPPLLILSPTTTKPNAKTASNSKYSLIPRHHQPLLKPTPSSLALPILTLFNALNIPLSPLISPTPHFSPVCLLSPYHQIPPFLPSPSPYHPQQSSCQNPPHCPSP